MLRCLILVVVISIPLIEAALSSISLPREEWPNKINELLHLETTKEQSFVQEVLDEHQTHESVQTFQDYYTTLIPQLVSKFQKRLNSTQFLISNRILGATAYWLNSQELVELEQSKELFQHLDTNLVMTTTIEVLLAKRHNVFVHLSYMYNMQHADSELEEHLQTERIMWTAELVHLFMMIRDWIDSGLDLNGIHSTESLQNSRTPGQYRIARDLDLNVSFPYSTLLELHKMRFAELVHDSIADETKSLSQAIMSQYNVKSLFAEKQYQRAKASGNPHEAMSMLHHHLELQRISRNPASWMNSHPAMDCMTKQWFKNISLESISAFESFKRIQTAINHNLIEHLSPSNIPWSHQRSNLGSMMIDRTKNDKYWQHLMRQGNTPIFILQLRASQTSRTIFSYNLSKSTVGDNFLQLVTLFSDKPVAFLAVFSAVIGRFSQTNEQAYCFFFHQFFLIIQMMKSAFGPSVELTLPVKEFLERTMSMDLSHQEFTRYFGIFSSLPQRRASLIDLLPLQIWQSIHSIPNWTLEERLKYMDMDPEISTGLQSIMTIFALPEEHPMTMALVCQAFLFNLIARAGLVSCNVHLNWVILACLSRNSSMSINSNNLCKVFKCIPQFLCRVSSTMSQEYAAMAPWYCHSWFSKLDKYILWRDNVLHLSIVSLLEILMAISREEDIGQCDSLVHCVYRQLYNVGNGSVVGILSIMTRLQYSPAMISHFQEQFGTKSEISLEELCTALDQILLGHTLLDSVSVRAIPINNATSVTATRVSNQDSSQTTGTNVAIAHAMPTRLL